MAGALAEAARLKTELAYCQAELKASKNFVARLKPCLKAEPTASSRRSPEIEHASRRNEEEIKLALTLRACKDFVVIDEERHGVVGIFLYYFFSVGYLLIWSQVRVLVLHLTVISNAQVFTLSRLVQFHILAVTAFVASISTLLVYTFIICIIGSPKTTSRSS